MPRKTQLPKILVLLVICLLIAMSFVQPAAAQSGTVHVVAPGETLSLIALRYGVSVQAIVAANDLSNPNLILSGQRLIIPDGASQPQPAPAPQPTPTSAPAPPPAPVYNPPAISSDIIREMNVVFVGDSHTDNGPNRWPETDSYAAGAGWTTAVILGWIPSHELAANPEVRQYPWQCGGQAPLPCEYERSRPRFAIILVGTNDMHSGLPPDVYKVHLERIIQITLHYGILPILNTIPRSYWANVWPYNEAVWQLGHQYQIPVIDLYTNTYNQVEEDGIHLTAEGVERRRILTETVLGWYR